MTSGMVESNLVQMNDEYTWYELSGTQIGEEILEVREVL